jgi:aminoglycoside phosphotransferase
MEKTLEERTIYKWFKNKGLGNPYTLNSNKKMQNWLKLTFSQRFNGEII